MRGHLYIVSAPSGAGKTTLVRLLLESDPDISLSISSTTRQPRSGEADGSAYHFIDVASFLERIDQGEFLEWAEVHGNYYGTSKRWIDAQLLAGRDVILEIDWQGAAQVRQVFPEAIGVFVMPPSLSTLKERLLNRATDSEATIAKRLAAAQDEMRHAHEFDYVIINDNLAQALKEIKAIVCASRLQVSTQRQKYPGLFEVLH